MSHRIAIIGAGFSGTLLTVQLFEQATDATVTLFERGGVFARGVAYSTKESHHLLNVPAEGMSAYPEHPDHFAQWAKKRGIEPGDFAPRKLYGDYLTEQFEQTRHRAGARLRQVADEVVDLQRDGGGYRLRTRGGDALEADSVVLALGGFPAGPSGSLPFPVDSARRVVGAWEEAALDAVRPDERIVILGSGLTMIDTVLTLKAKGHRGPIRVVSRHGYLPQRHAALEPRSASESLLNENGLRAKLRHFRRECEAGAGDWRAVIRSVRAATPNLWRGFTTPERARFLRHLRSLWDTHRHLMAPQIARQLDVWQADGSLGLLAGRIEGVDARGVHIRPRGETASETLATDLVVNCLGLEGDFRRMKHPLVVSLLEHRLVRADALGLGIEVDPEGRVIDGEGMASPSLFALGSLRRGESWESVAVPELRGQAQDLARLLAR